MDWLARQAAEEPEGFILLMREDATSVATSSEFSLHGPDASLGRDAPGEAVLALPESALFRYDAFIAWLRQHATVRELVYELDEAELS